ncbi:Uncharacterised protein [Mycobacteroides abscessus]|nr:Uncharacterised protein [Mycobacteroides abscessus]
MSFERVFSGPAGTTRRAPGNRADSAARRATVNGAAGRGSTSSAARGAQPLVMKALNASESGRWERLLPRAARSWVSPGPACSAAWSGVSDRGAGVTGVASVMPPVSHRARGRSPRARARARG